MNGLVHPFGVRTARTLGLRCGWRTWHELIGTAAMHALMNIFDHLICGSVTMIPCANPDGAVRRVRHGTMDRHDLNRAFPASTGVPAPNWHP